MKTEARPAPSPEDLLKAAVAGRAEPTSTAATESKGSRVAAWDWLRGDARLLGTAGAALALGLALGAAGIALIRSGGDAPGQSIAALSASIDGTREEAGRLGGEVAQLRQTVLDLRTTSEVARKDAAGRGGAISDRLAQVEKALSGKLGALGERLDQAEREQSARTANLAAQIERRAPAKAEPTQTGSLAEPKPADHPIQAKPVELKSAEAKPAEIRKAAAEKPPVIDGWAVRDVFDGTAIVENRRRRLVEVGPGDTLPGVGRVESVERQGRVWVVVTRQGLVTPQPW